MIANNRYTNFIIIRLVAIFILFTAVSVRAAETPSSAAVASAHPLATKAGVEIIRQGGNAFDAAVAVTAALAVVEPSGSGLGGGGFWLLHRAIDGKQIMLDGREKAPALAHHRMYQDEDGNIIGRASIDGPLAAGIPGIPAGIVHLAKNYGRLPLSKSLRPAIRYAKQGYKIGKMYRKLIGFRQQAMLNYPEAASIFLHNNAVPEPGYRLIQKDLAKTLKRIADNGFDGFYKGPYAEKMVLDVRIHGGIWSIDDLANYKVLEREPITIHYRDIKLVSAAPPSSGGVVLGQALSILEHFDLNSLDNTQRKHIVIEAMRRAYRDRAVYLGDPDFYAIPVQRLLDKDYLAGLAMNIDLKHATPSSELSDTQGLTQASTQTTHFSVLDSEGNRVAGTLSINLMFGSGFVPKGTGVLLNNEMDDFSSKDNTPNAYGLVGFEANAIQAGKRPLSSMTPTFIESDDRIAILGTPGGSRIISMVLLAALDFIDGGSAESMVSTPRYHHQYLPDVVTFERDGFSREEEVALILLGHKLKGRKRRYGNMHSIIWDKKTDTITAASDPRVFRP